jgi:hypothetical protein
MMGLLENKRTQIQISGSKDQCFGWMIDGNFEDCIFIFRRIDLLI